MPGRKLSHAIIYGLTAFSLTTSAFADLSAPCGWYLEANFGSSKLTNANNYPGSTNNCGIAGNANLGYKFMPYVGLEIGYSQYANITVKAPPDSTTAGNIKYYSYDIALRGIVPMGGSGFEIFGKVGPQRLNAHVSIKNQEAATAIGLSNSRHSATGLYLGLGGQYYFFPELAVVAQWQRASGDNSTGNVELWSLGLSFLFD